MPRLFLLVLGLLFVVNGAAGFDAAHWLDRYRLEAPAAYEQSVAAHASAELPAFTVTPAAAGKQMVRVSLPFAPGALADGLGLEALAGDVAIECGLRVLTHHPGTPRWVRRAIVSFPHDFDDDRPVRFSLRPIMPSNELTLTPLTAGSIRVAMDADGIVITTVDGASWRAVVIAPDRDASLEAELEVVEHNAHYLWARLLVPDSRWPRILEVRADSAGSVALQVHVQRREDGDAYAPDLGWRVETRAAFEPFEPHAFQDGEAFQAVAGDRVLSFPIAPLTRKGEVSAEGSTLTYRRCVEGDLTPFQSHAWRRAAVAIQPAGQARLTPLLEPAHHASIDAAHFDALYGSGEEIGLSPWPNLEALRAFNRDGIVGASVRGDDYGNVTSFGVNMSAAVFGMNRLNHCPPIFEEHYRSGDARLRETALLWCGNMHDLSIWWGDDRHFGGTRYNNAVAAGQQEHAGDTRFMWRTNGGQHTFCTKGYDSFFYAWEETGDPRMATALRHQAAFAAEHVHANRGEARNVGDVADFARLYRFTGQPAYREEAFRLWRQLREVLGEDALFSQSGQPIEPDRPFIDDDAFGYHHPFAKPYIIGYALSGCPWLLEWEPDEPRLREMVRAVSGFLAESIDPVGGWRYPAPESSATLISQGIEHAAQLVRAARAMEAAGEDTRHLLDSIETVLQGRVNGFVHTGAILASLQGWERSTGDLAEGETLHERYAKPGDRDRSRDYDEGNVSVGGAPPDGLVYLSEVLAFYLERRPAERLFNRTPELQRVLARVEPIGRPELDHAEPITLGVERLLPSFNAKRVAQMEFPLAWRHSSLPFADWRAEARSRLFDALGDAPPRTAFEPEVLATEDRGTHRAIKLAFNIHAWQRVTGYLLVPHGEGPFPAILALHDHGAHFSIGKEKVVKPFEVSEERLEDAQQWVDNYYGGRWIGDELAARGFVVFATDALYWGDRGREGGPRFEDQQALGANMLHLGMSWAGNNLWDDIRAAEFLQSRPEADPDRIGAIGLSMGAYRTWNLAAATDIIRAGAAICWLGDTEGLAAPGNNQTTGQSAFSMLQPHIRNALDYPDVASIACPKPMLFHNGTEDALFPVDSVERAYGVMAGVWESQGAADRLETKLWPVPHLFNTDMQEEAFGFLERWLGE